MSTIHFDKVPMVADAAATAPDESAPWLWDGYLGAGNVTLLTSMWKAGKTTLLTGLLQALAVGGEFLGRAVRPSRALVVSEESRAMWAERLRTIPVGPHVELLARPFRGRPSVAEWNALIDAAAESRRRGELDLFVVDPLAPFLPGRCESDAATLLEALQPLHRLAAEGVAVLLLHHPRKGPSEPGSSARGSGALLGFVDIVLELHRYGRLRTDNRRRQIVGQSRRSVDAGASGVRRGRGDGSVRGDRGPADESVRGELVAGASAAGGSEGGGDAPGAVGGLAGGGREAVGERAVRVAEPGVRVGPGAAAGVGHAERPLALPAAAAGGRAVQAPAAAGIAVTTDRDHRLHLKSAPHRESLISHDFFPGVPGATVLE